MHQHSGYMKSPHSLKSEDIDNISQHSDDMDDDLDRPMSSPQLPLSLTTHERHRSRSIDESSIKNERNRSRSPSSGPHNMLSSTHNDIGGGRGGGDHETDDQQQDRLDGGDGGGVGDGDATDQLLSESNENGLMYDVQNSLHQRASSSSLKDSPQSEDLDMESDINPMDDFRSPSPDSRRDLKFPIVPNSMFSHSIMYMSHYIPQMAASGVGGGMGQAGGGGGGGEGGYHHHSGLTTPDGKVGGHHTNHGLGNAANSLSLANMSSEERRKRNRTFIDPVTEVPKLEQWFTMNTHPSHNLILKYTEDLNRMPYR